MRPENLSAAGYGRDSIPCLEWGLHPEGSGRSLADFEQGTELHKSKLSHKTLLGKHSPLTNKGHSMGICQSKAWSQVINLPANY